MSLKFFCDICNKETGNPIRIEYKFWATYCEDCWTDKENWKYIHESKKEGD
jgi:hypothetical protein